MSGIKRFYDIHCHAMNLSHPNLLAFIRRYNLSIILMAASLLGPVAPFLLGNRLHKVHNLLSLMENDIGSLFLSLENCVVESPLFKKGWLDIAGSKYDKIVLTPLMMDFGYKGAINPNIHYNKPPEKPVVEQVVDVFNGIRQYHAKSDKKLFEIYPFLGINTQNYLMGNSTSARVSRVPDLSSLPGALKCKTEYHPRLGKLVFYGKMAPDESMHLAGLFDSPQDIEAVTGIYNASQALDSGNTIPKMLKKYFGNHSGSRAQLFGNMGGFAGDIENITANYFAGIKLYPPLGFDPWPEDDEEEMVKVTFLYRFSCEKNIPITAHCSDGGFKVTGNARRFTSPYRWEKVLQSFPGLKLNLAHFGKQGTLFRLFSRENWERKIISLIERYDNVYVDFSCNGFDYDYYTSLKTLVKSAGQGMQEKMRSRILFGSDFLINLLWAESYCGYLDIFAQTRSFTAEEKNRFCSINPERFLF